MGAQTAGSAALQRVPLGRRASRGKRRWYLVRTQHEQGQATCDKLRRVVSPELLEDAFVMRKERWRKCDGEWGLFPVPMYQDYLFVVTSDVTALDREFSRLSFPVQIEKTDGNHFAPLSADAQEWYEGALDDDRIIRNSTAVIVDGELHVQDGPLIGQESRIRKIDRHRRQCMVDIADGGDGMFSEFLPMEVPLKS